MNQLCNVLLSDKDKMMMRNTVQLNKKLSLPHTNYRPQHTLHGTSPAVQGYEVYL